MSSADKSFTIVAIVFVLGVTTCSALDRWADVETARAKQQCQCGGER